jgi:hypothetical protein
MRVAGGFEAQQYDAFRCLDLLVFRPLLTHKGASLFREVAVRSQTSNV